MSENDQEIQIEEPRCTGSEYSDLLSVDSVRLRAQIKVLLDMEQAQVHKWYCSRIRALEEWARKQDKSIKEAVFGCLANGSPLVHERTNYAAQYNKGC